MLNLDQFLLDAHWLILLGALVLSIAAVSKGADWLVDEAVVISLRSGLPKVIIGATVVSLGTTTPEAAVSVLAAFGGNYGLALGNSVGSIICDTGLILGLACIIDPLPIDRRLVNRQGWVQFGCGWLLVLCCIPWVGFSWTTASLPQWAGLLFLVLLMAYFTWSVRLARDAAETEDPLDEHRGKLHLSLLRLFVAIAVVVASSHLLIAAATAAAERLDVPDSVVAATLVAFGTSLPELVTALAAVRKKQGELAVGNVIGADILNVLFVAGAAAAVSPDGLKVDPHFFRIQFPGMLFVLLVFRIGIWRALDGRLKRGFGLVLLLTYFVVTIVSYTAS